MKSLIRIEHSDGQGLFGRYTMDEDGGISRDSIVARNVPDLQYLFNRHQDFNAPSEEPFADEFIQGKHFCAYKSLQQLNNWILPEEMSIILSIGYKVYLIDVSEYLEGEHQICYRKSHILNKKDISSIFKTTS